MTQALRRRIESEIQRADGWTEGRDPAPVLEALGYVLSLQALGLRELLCTADSRRLTRVGARALLAWDREPDADDGDGAAQVSRRQIQAIAQAGLAVLSAKRPSTTSMGATHPPTRTVLRMLEGELDGLTAGHYAAHMLGCKSCQRELSVLRSVSVTGADSGRFAIAAAKPASVRPPAGGRTVAERRRPTAVEAVLFADEDGRRLALYARAHEPVRLVADGVTTEETLAGYWLGQLTEGLQEVRATVHVGSDSFEWTFRLDP